MELQEKVASRETDVAFDRQVRFKRDWLIPQPNLYPGSFYMMKKLAGVSQCFLYADGAGCYVGSHL